jgi:signal transduction histidine kinase
MSLEDKRRHLKALRNALKHGAPSELSQSDMSAIHLLAEDADWQVRQDVAELLLYVPEDDFARLTGRLMADPNGYVRRSAERNRERRQKARTEARQAGRGIEQVANQYESLARRFGQEVADEAIRLAETRFGVLADALIHDLLQRVAVLKSEVRQLTNGLADKDLDLLQTATKASEGIDGMAQYIRAVAAYSQALPTDRHPEWVHEVVRQAVEQAQRSIQEEGLDLRHVVLDDGGISDARVPMCRELVVQAVANIVTNAYEALLDENGKLEKGGIGISVRAAAGDIAIEIRDNGCGMSPKELTALLAFLPGKKNGKKKRSMGLGLLTAKKNVEAHGGTLNVESKLGEGTVVTVTLPLTAKDVQNGPSSDR